MLYEPPRVLPKQDSAAEAANPVRPRCVAHQSIPLPSFGPRSKSPSRIPLIRRSSRRLRQNPRSGTKPPPWYPNRLAQGWPMIPRESSGRLAEVCNKARTRRLGWVKWALFSSHPPHSSPFASACSTLARHPSGHAQENSSHERLLPCGYCCTSLAACELPSSRYSTRPARLNGSRFGYDGKHVWVKRVTCRWLASSLPPYPYSAVPSQVRRALTQ
jgi:hypothetical protein